MAAKLTERHQASGVISIDPEEGLKCLEFALQQHNEHLVCISMDWKLYMQNNEYPLLSELVDAKGKKEKIATLLPQLQECSPSKNK